MNGIIRSGSLTGYADVARKTGLDPATMLREFDLPARCLDRPDMPVPIDAVRALLEASATRSGVPAFGLLMAETRRLSNMGAFGLLVREQPTARLALETFVTYGRRLNGALLLSIEEFAEVVVLREELVFGRRGPVRQATELAIGVAYRALRELLGPDWHPRSVCFAHNAPGDVTTHERVFGTHVEFGHDFNGIVLARSDLDHTNFEADPELARLALRLLDFDSPDLGGGSIREVREIVVTLLPTRTCTIDRVAQHMGVGRRTLHRRLAGEGESFSGIVQAVRTELADRYLNDGRKVADVAALLGFSTASGFSHWHRRLSRGERSQRRPALQASVALDRDRL